MKKSILLSTLLILSLSARDNPFASVGANNLQNVQPPKIEQKVEPKIEKPVIKTPVAKTIEQPKPKWTEPISKPTPVVKVKAKTKPLNEPSATIKKIKEPVITETKSVNATKHGVAPIVHPYDPNEIVFIEDQKKTKVKPPHSTTTKTITANSESEKNTIVGSTIYSNNFVKIKVENDEVKIVTKDKLLKKFILPSPLRYALDIKKELIKFPSKTIPIDADVAKTIRIGAHIDFYRISIELNRYKNAHLIETNYGYLLTFK